MSMIFISAQILHSVQKLQSYRMWCKGMYINPEDDTSYTTKYQEVCLKYVEVEYCAKHRHGPVNTSERVQSRNLFPSALASGSGQSSFDRYNIILGLTAHNLATDHTIKHVRKLGCTSNYHTQVPNFHPTTTILPRWAE